MSLEFIGSVLSLIGLLIAATQIRVAVRDSRQSRNAELSWSIYQEYIGQELRDARGVAESIARQANPPVKTAEDYKQIVAGDDVFNARNQDDELIRRLLRFYNQVGILVQKNLVDVEFVRTLLAGGMSTSWSVLDAAIEFYQNYYAGFSGTEKAHRRDIYEPARDLYHRLAAT